jgi:hypothetical protein
VIEARIVVGFGAVEETGIVMGTGTMAEANATAEAGIVVRVCVLIGPGAIVIAIEVGTVGEGPEGVIEPEAVVGAGIIMGTSVMVEVDIVVAIGAMGEGVVVTEADAVDRAGIVMGTGTVGIESDCSSDSSALDCLMAFFLLPRRFLAGGESDSSFDSIAAFFTLHWRFFVAGIFICS